LHLIWDRRSRDPFGHRFQSTVQIRSNNENVKRLDESQISASKVVVAVNNGGGDNIKINLTIRRPDEYREFEIKVPVIYTKHQFAFRSR